MPLDADVVRLAKASTLATVVTLMPDGQPQALLTVQPEKINTPRSLGRR